MELNIKIFLDGVLQEKKFLPLGEYTLGRSSKSDIILNHQGVSRNHAIVSVSEQKIIIKDNNSMSGTYYLEKKFSCKTFKKNFSVEIGPFDIAFEFEDQTDNSVKKEKPAQKLDFSLFNIDTVLLSSLIFLVLITSFFIHLALKSQISNFQEKELMNRGHIITRCFLELNEDSFKKGRYNSLKTDSIKNEVGVKYAVIVDRNGKIITSSEEDNKSFAQGILLKVIKSRKFEEAEGKMGEKIICYPIKKMNDVVGAVVIGYDLKQRLKSYEIKNYSFIVVIFISIICIFLKSFLMKIFYKPVKELAEIFDDTLKNGRNRIEFHSRSEEIRELISCFNRLLLRTTIPESIENKEEDSLKNLHKKKNVETPVNELFSFENIELPACIIDKSQNSIVKYNQLFDTFISNTELLESESDLTEIFAKDRPEVLNAVFEITEGIKSEIRIDTETEHFLIKSFKSIENNIIIVFEEIENG